MQLFFVDTRVHIAHVAYTVMFSYTWFYAALINELVNHQKLGLTWCYGISPTQPS